MAVKHVNTDVEYQQEMISVTSEVVVVDFHATW